MGDRAVWGDWTAEMRSISLGGIAGTPMDILSEVDAQVVR
jgi:hypothetical protein